MIKIAFLFLLSCSSKKIEPNNQTLIDSFSATLDKTTTQLAQCMAVVDSCNEARDKVDAQIKAIFDITKEEICD